MTMREVKDIDHVLSFCSSFLCVHGARRSRGPQTRKEGTKPISGHLDRTSFVNKGFIIWTSEKSYLRDTAGSPDRAR